MTTEEKARAYDKAIEKIKYVMEHGVSPTLNKEDLQDIFPTLREFDDERIIKAQLDYWRSVGGNEWHGVPVQETIAWLEKQGKKKDINPTLIEKEKMDDAFTKMMFKGQVDGFDAELNALLKKYEHLPKEEILGCLNFYVLVLGKEMEEQQ